MPSSHPAIQGASKRNTVRGRFEFPKQTNAEKLEGFLGRVVNQLMLDWAVESGGIRWKTSLWRSPLSHHTTTQFESPSPGPTEPIATRLVHFGRRNSLLSVLICIKGVTSIGPHSPFRILRKGGKSIVTTSLSTRLNNKAIPSPIDRLRVTTRRAHIL